MPGETIRLVDPDGTLHDVPLDTAAQALQDPGWRVASHEDEASRVAGQAREAEYGGVGGGIKAGAAAFARGATLGLSDVAARAIGGDDAAIALEGYREAHPYVSFGAELGGAIAPALLTGGAALPAGAVSSLGRTVGAAAGGGLRGALAAGATEGALFGAGAGVSELALSQDPLTFEHAATAIGSNALFGAATGAALGAGANAVERGLHRAGAAIDEYVAKRAAREAVAPDLATLDRKGLKLAEEAEHARIEAERVGQRAAVADEIAAFREDLKQQKIWLTTKKGAAEEGVPVPVEAPPVDVPMPVEPPAAAPPPVAPPTRVEVRPVGRPSERKFEAVVDGETVPLSGRGEVSDWVKSRMPEGFTDGGLIELHRPFSIEQGIPASPADIANNALYVARPSEFAQRGVMGNELHPEHVASIADARAGGKRLDPILVDVAPDGRLFIEDGNHRLQQAAATDAPVAVRFRKTGPDWTPQRGARDITEQIKSTLPKSGAPGPNPAIVQARARLKDALDAGYTDDGFPAIDVDAQEAIRSSLDDAAKSYGMHHRTADAEYGASVLVTHPTETDPHLRLADDFGHGSFHNEDLKYPGLVVVSPAQARGLRAHASLGTDELAALGKAAEAGNEEALWRYIDAHVMHHETLHGYGPRITPDGKSAALEELTTELASRRISADMHGLPTTSETAAVAYIHVIDPVVDHMAQVTGASWDDAYRALEDAAIKFKSRTEGRLSSDWAIEHIAKDAAAALGKPSAKQGIAEGLHRVSREVDVADRAAGEAADAARAARRARTGTGQPPSAPEVPTAAPPAAPVAPPQIEGLGPLGKRLLKTDRALDRLLDNPKALADRPQRALDALQMQEAAYEDLIAKSDQLRIKFAADTSGDRVAALDAIPAALERNRALQAKISELLRPPRTPRLDAIAEARDVLSQPAPPKSMVEQAFGGTAFGAISAAARAVPVLGAIPGVASFIGAKGAELATRVVFGKLGETIGARAERLGSAVKGLLGVVKATSPYAPVVATKTLAALRYGTDERDKQASTLPELYKARTDEIKRLTAYDETGTPRMKPAAREALGAKLRPIAAINPVMADRIETVKARGIEYLSGIIPRRPDVAGVPTGPDNWQPSDMAMRSWARSAAAVEDPYGVLERAIHGAVTPEDSAALRVVYPELLNAFATETTTKLPELRTALPYSRQLSLSILTGVPVTPAMDPKVMRVLQGQFPGEPGSAGGTQAPKTTPQFGSMRATSESQPTPAQNRAQGVHA